MAATTITVNTPGRHRAVPCEDHGTHYVVHAKHGDVIVDRSLIDAALQHFAGQKVAGDFEPDAADRAPNSFAEWVASTSAASNTEPLRAVDGCFVAAILCDIFGVAALRRGRKVWLRFP